MGKIRGGKESLARDLQTEFACIQGFSAVAFRPDGKFILAGSWDSTLKIWNSEKKKL